MALETALKQLGIHLCRPLSRASYDFAYRTDGITEATKLASQFLLESVGGVDQRQINGYWNVKIDLWKLHIDEGWTEISYKSMESSAVFEAVLLRALYLSRLLKPCDDAQPGLPDAELERLLQMIHFPTLYLSAGSDLGQLFLDFTLDRNLRKLSEFTQGQIHSICTGLCRCSKTGTCAQ